MPTSSAPSPSPQEIAEDAFAWLNADAPVFEFLREDELVLRWSESPHPTWNMALRPRLRDVDGSLARTRAWFAARDRRSYTWWVSDAARPPDLTSQLLDRGLVRDDDEPHLTGMVLTREPDAVEGVSVRKVETFEDSVRAAEISWRSFGLTDAQIEASRSRHRMNWKRRPGEVFVAEIDGEIVGSGTAGYLERAVYLAAGNVAEEARGRGVYRALVRARWDEAVRRGTPTLVVQAGKQSAPILQRLGFETVCGIDILVDSFA